VAGVGTGVSSKKVGDNEGDIVGANVGDSEGAKVGGSITIMYVGAVLKSIRKGD